MKFAIRMFTMLLFLAGCGWLIHFSNQNKRLGEDIRQLEAELGRMSIDDVKRIHLVEIESPDVPPEVRSHLEGVWQFRCYLPPNYALMQIMGDGRITADGIYQSGGSSSSWGSPKPEAVHELVTVSFQKRDNRMESFFSFGGSHSTTSWQFYPEKFEALVIQKLVSSNQGPRSFDQNTILPLLRIYDPSTVEEQNVGNQTLTTYAGGLVLLCPVSREQEVNELRAGKTPNGFDSNWIAKAADDE
jgi:hypothetical protein